jgi:peroxiredoxin
MGRWIRTVAIAAALCAALGGAAGTAGAADAAGEPATKLKIGDKAPDFALKDLAGREVRLSGFAGKQAVVLAFWSLRCGACVTEVPYLEALHKTAAARGFAVVSVLTDGVDAETSKSIMADVGVEMSYPVLVDPDFAASDTYTSFVVPHTLVIDRKGVIRYQHVGFEKGVEKQYEAAVLQALK